MKMKKRTMLWWLAKTTLGVLSGRVTWIRSRVTEKTGRTQVTPVDPPSDPPQHDPPALWKRLGQHRWWHAACMNIGSNWQGASQEAIDRLHLFRPLDPNAPMKMRPYGIMHLGGVHAPRLRFWQQMQQHMKHGYRIVYAQFGGIDDLERDLEAGANASVDVSRLIVSAGNEEEFNEKITVEEFETLCESLMPRLDALHAKYGCKVALPALSSIMHANGAYGRVFRKFSAVRSYLVALVHSYGRVQPRYYLEGDLKNRMEANMGMPVILSENGNQFSGSEATEMKVGTEGPGAEEFAEKMGLVAGMIELPVCPFLWEHRDPLKLYLDDIGHPKNGISRRAGINKAVSTLNERGPGNIPATDLILDPEHSRGKLLSAEQVEALGSGEVSPI